MKIVVTGGKGQLGSEVVRRAGKGVVVLGPGRQELDITDGAALERMLEDQRPDLVVNAAAYTAVDRAEAAADEAAAVNHGGTRLLAQACVRRGVPLVHISTDYVFDGRAREPIREDHPTGPLGAYGRTKLDGEEAVRATHPQHVILRTSWIFGASGGKFVKTILRLARERDELHVVADQHGCPTWAGHVAEVILQLANRLDGDGKLPWGVYHYCGSPPTTWHGFAEEILALARQHEPIRARFVRAIRTSEHPTPAPRPQYSVLCCEKLRQTFGIRPRPWREGLEATLKELRS